MNEKTETLATEADENRLIAERRAKLQELREAGQAYPNDFRKDTISSDLHARFADALAEELEAVEERAREEGVNTLFVLTTRTSHWFRERGFRQADLTKLPVKKRKLYNYQRNAKVFTKRID